MRVHRRWQRSPDDRSAAYALASPASPGVQRVLDLQHTAGNAAVSRAVQREAGSAEIYAATLESELAKDKQSFTAAAVGTGTTERSGAEVRGAMSGASAAQLHEDLHPTMAQLGVPPAQVRGRAIGAYVANSTYTAKGFSSLPGAVRDGAVMEKLMKANRYKTLFSGRDYKGFQLAGSYRSAVAEANPGDGLFLYYAGHGWPKGLVGVDAATNDADAVTAATHTYADLLGTVELGVAKGVHVTLVVDACNSGALTDLVRVKEERRLGASTDERVKAVMSHIAHLRGLLAQVTAAGGRGDGRGFTLVRVDPGPPPPSAQKLWTDKIRPALAEVEPAVTTPGESLNLPGTVSDMNDIVQLVTMVITRLLDLAHRLEQPPPAPPPQAG